MADTLNPTTAASSPHSPPPRRSRAKKRDDPFDRIPQLSPSPSQRALSPEDDDQRRHDEDGDGPGDNLLTKLVVSPLIFTSFLVSLFLVDRRDRAWRARQHPAASLWARFSNWIDPEPYQDPDRGTWHKDEGSGDARNPAVDGSAVADRPAAGWRRWSRQKKHRKMAKYEFEDAFALKDSIAAWLFGALLLAVGGSVYAVKSVFGWALW